MYEIYKLIAQIRRTIWTNLSVVRID